MSVFDTYQLKFQRDHQQWESQCKVNQSYHRKQKKSFSKQNMSYSIGLAGFALSLITTIHSQAAIFIVSCILMYIGLQAVKHWYL